MSGHLKGVHKYSSRTRSGNPFAIFMIKKLRVIVDGNPYDVTVEVLEDSDSVAESTPAPNPLPPATPPPVLSPTPAVSSPPTAASPGDVLSPLAGRVIAVVAKAGQEVKENDHLLTLEAMKMNTFVFAPKAGKVLEIKVNVGDVVSEGQILVRLG
jgi:glutaconyl-CoA/methylmalonyl-CoA decarboxylase subunit gamma